MVVKRTVSVDDENSGTNEIESFGVAHGRRVALLAMLVVAPTLMLGGCSDSGSSSGADGSTPPTWTCGNGGMPPCSQR